MSVNLARWEPHLDPDTEPGLVTKWSGATYSLLAALTRGDIVEELGDRLSDDIRSVIITLWVIIPSRGQVQCPETDRDGLHGGGGMEGAAGVGQPGVAVPGHSSPHLRLVQFIFLK